MVDIKNTQSCWNGFGIRPAPLGKRGMKKKHWQTAFTFRLAMFEIFLAHLTPKFHLAGIGYLCTQPTDFL